MAWCLASVTIINRSYLIPSHLSTAIASNSYEIESWLPVGIISVMDLMFESKRIRCIPVVDSQKKLVGVVGRKDVLAYYAKHF